MQKNIVFFDIDGTLYDYMKGIPSSTVAAIRTLRENGHLAVICTGRTRIMIFDEILKLGFDGIIAGGGTYVEYEKQHLFEYVLPPEETYEVVQCMRENGFVPIPEGSQNIYFDMAELNREFAPIYDIYKRELPYNILPIDRHSIRASKVSGRFTSHSNWNGIFSRLNSKYTFVNHGGALLELIPKAHSKAAGVERLLEFLHIDRKNTYAFGDSFNDLEMLQYVEYGVAMGNASPELKELVEYETDDMFEDGINNGLKRFGLI